jgi:hypothetical protein
LGPDATFITGADLLMDGGVIAAIRSDRVQLHMGWFPVKLERSPRERQ